MISRDGYSSTGQAVGYSSSAQPGGYSSSVGGQAAGVGGYSSSGQQANYGTYSSGPSVVGMYSSNRPTFRSGYYSISSPDPDPRFCCNML